MGDDDSLTSSALLRADCAVLCNKGAHGQAGEHGHCWRKVTTSDKYPSECAALTFASWAFASASRAASASATHRRTRLSWLVGFGELLTKNRTQLRCRCTGMLEIFRLLQHLRDRLTQTNRHMGARAREPMYAQTCFTNCPGSGAGTAYKRTRPS